MNDILNLNVPFKINPNGLVYEGLSFINKNAYSQLYKAKTSIGGREYEMRLKCHAAYQPTLRYPNPFFHRVVEQNPTFMVSPWVEGIPLHAISDRSNLASTFRIFDNVLFMVSQCAHGNLKPGNIICNNDLTSITLMDPSFLLPYSSHPELSPDVFAYKSPEQLDKNSHDYQSDIYAIGLMLYNILTGTTAPNAFERKKGVEVQPIKNLRPDLDRTQAEAIMKAMRFNPSDRHQTPEELREHLFHTRSWNIPAPVAQTWDEMHPTFYQRQLNDVEDLISRRWADINLRKALEDRNILREKAGLPQLELTETEILQIEFAELSHEMSIDVENLGFDKFGWASIEQIQRYNSLATKLQKKPLDIEELDSRSPIYKTLMKGIYEQTEFQEDFEIIQILLTQQKIVEELINSEPISRNIEGMINRYKTITRELHAVADKYAYYPF